MAFVKMEMPEEMVSFMLQPSKEEQLKRNAMMLYPYIHDNVISYGRAAEILGIFKMDLIVLYGKLGLPYIDFRYHSDSFFAKSRLPGITGKIMW